MSAGPFTPYPADAAMLDSDAATMSPYLAQMPTGPVTATPVDDGGIDPDTGMHWTDPSSRAHREREDRMENYEGADIGFGDVLKFLTMDPGECFGDGASGSGCGVELGALLPWGKWLKLGKLGKVGKNADPPKPKPEPKPKPTPPKVHDGKQGKHVPGHNNYEPGRSILESNPNDLAKRAGEGTPANKVPRGDPGFKERIDYGEPIGKYIDPKTGVATETSKAILVYAKDGSVHIIPARP